MGAQTWMLVYSNGSPREVPFWAGQHPAIDPEAAGHPAAAIRQSEVAAARRGAGAATVGTIVTAACAAMVLKAELILTHADQ